jgi:WhiB family transcriptional regulator, redox-sensing transcriptional regulator
VNNYNEKMWDAIKLADLIKEEAFGKTPCMDDPDRWFPEQSSDVGFESAPNMKSINATKQECKSHCFVIAECLAYALKHREDQGIWGGTSSIERRQLRTLRKKMSDPNAKVNF